MIKENDVGELIGGECMLSASKEDLCERAIVGLLTLNDECIEQEGCWMVLFSLDPLILFPTSRFA